MSADREFCQKQLARCRSQRDFEYLLQPGMDDVRKELVDALMAATRDDEHARQTIDLWLRTSRFRPTICDLYTTAEAIPEQLDLPEPCDACRDTHGWVPTGVGGDAPKPGTVAFWDYCGCPLGRALAERNRRPAA